MKPGERRTIRNVAHVLVVLHIEERDQFGRPKRASILYDEDVVKVKNGDEFVTCFVPEVTVKKGAN